MKARALLHKGQLITIWNGDEDIHQQIIKFIEDNEEAILGDIEYNEGGSYQIDQHYQFFEYTIEISGDNGCMIFETLIYEI